jgi:hypothetical protein
VLQITAAPVHSDKQPHVGIVRCDEVDQTRGRSISCVSELQASSKLELDCDRQEQGQTAVPVDGRTMH